MVCISTATKEVITQERRTNLDFHCKNKLGQRQTLLQGQNTFKFQKAFQFLQS